MDKSGNIAVFDSGMGGLSVLKNLIRLLPCENYVYYADSLNVPYGLLSKKSITKNTVLAVENLLEMNVKAIVIACNTATGACIEFLRKNYDVPILGIEPAVKTALEECGNEEVFILSTVRTKKEMSKKYERNDSLVFCGLKTLACDIENNIFNAEFLRRRIEKIFCNIDEKKVKYVVLGCTHFVLIKEYLKEFFINAKFYDGNSGISRRLNYILLSKELKTDSQEMGNVKIYNSSNSFAISDKYYKVLERFDV